MVNELLEASKNWAWTSQEQPHHNLEAMVGEQIFTSPGFKVTQQGIENFAQVTGDRQWIHIDPERARKESPYRSTIAHGFFLVSLIPYLRDIDNDKHYQPFRLAINIGVDNIRFLSAVKPGQYVCIRSRLSDVRNFGRYVEVVEHIIMEKHPQYKTVCSMDSILRLYY